jgi:hypothetical protein
VTGDGKLESHQLNLALLERQFLLEYSSLGLVETIEQIGGLQTQYAPSGYIGLWSRLEGFHREDLTRALEERRIIQGTLLRNTIHMVSAADYWLLLAATAPSRQEWFTRLTRNEKPPPRMEEAADIIRSELNRGPRAADELKKALTDRGFSRISWNGLSAWVHMVRLPPSGTWERRRADTYELADRWLKPVKHSESRGLQHVVRRYLGAFGAAAVQDIAGWAGVPNAKITGAINAMKLTRYADERGKPLFDLPELALPDSKSRAPVRFLPTWDATLLVHARRTQILPEAYRPLVFNTKTPHSKPTYLVDGQVAGSWRHDGGRIVLEPFKPLPRSVRAELEREAKRLAAFMN